MEICQKLKVIYKRCKRLGKSDENEVDVLNQAKRAFKYEFNGRLFTHQGPWKVLRKCTKWNAPEPVDPAPVEGGHIELFGEDPRPRPPRARAAIEPNLRARREFNGRSFTHEGPWKVLRKCTKWNAPEPVDPTPVEGGHTELFGEDPRPRPPGERAATEPNLRTRRVPRGVTRKCLWIR
nr:hypothetical protein [Tanacetum cinerariifolium]